MLGSFAKRLGSRVSSGFMPGPSSSGGGGFASGLMRLAAARGGGDGTQPRTESVRDGMTSQMPGSGAGLGFAGSAGRALGRGTAAPVIRRTPGIASGFMV